MYDYHNIAAGLSDIITRLLHSSRRYIFIGSRRRIRSCNGGSQLHAAVVCAVELGGRNQGQVNSILSHAAHFALTQLRVMCFASDSMHPTVWPVGACTYRAVRLSPCLHHVCLCGEIFLKSDNFLNIGVHRTRALKATQFISWQTFADRQGCRLQFETQRHFPATHFSATRVSQSRNAHDPRGQSLPSGHGVGADDPFGQKAPAGHSTDDVGVAQKRPLGHGSQDFLPGHVTYVPGGHLVASHMPGWSHLCPIGQSVWAVFCVPGQ